MFIIGIVLAECFLLFLSFMFSLQQRTTELQKPQSLNLENARSLKFCQKGKKGFPKLISEIVYLLILSNAVIYKID